MLTGLLTGQTKVHFFTAGGDISLSVQEQGYFAQHYVQTLAWYHNGTRITDFQRIAISDDYQRINITNTQSSDAGNYQVKITGLSIYGIESPACDALLPLLESHHAAFAPVTLLVKESQKCKFDMLVLLISTTNTFCNTCMIVCYTGEAEYSPTYPPVDTFYFSEEKGNSFLIEKTIVLPTQLNLSRTLDLSTTQWFYNGIPISTSNSKYNASYTKYRDNFCISLEINNFIAEDAGVYVFTLNTDTVTILLELLQSCSESWLWHEYYFYLQIYLSLYEVTLAKAVFTVEEYRKFMISILYI